MSEGTNQQPPARIEVILDEALDLLADLEDARHALSDSRHLIAAVTVEVRSDCSAVKLGFADRYGGDHDG
jgi:hypothetical protein